MAETLCPRDALGRERQQVVRDGKEAFDVMKRRQIQAVGVIDDVASIDDTPVGRVLPGVRSSDAALEDEAALGVRPGKMIEDAIDAFDEIAVIRAIGAVDAALEKGRAVCTGANAETSGAREPRIVISRREDPRS